MLYKILAIIVGTRPEAIKLAPLILLLKQHPYFKPYIIATGQHQELVQQVFDLFGITADVNLQVMQENQSLSLLTSRLLAALETEFNHIKPAGVIAQGDTTSVLAASLVCFYQRLPFFHVEAGLRSHDIDSPFPEEFNRQMATKLAQLHFAPTMLAKKNLLAEGINDENILITGNTVVDALQYIAARANFPRCDLPHDKRIVLLTMHRRENFGEHFNNVCAAVLDLVKHFPDVHVVYPVHPNPNIRLVAEKLLAQHPQISLVAPLDYQAFVALMKKSYLIMTDSGGIQEEAPALGKPVLVLRNETERPEGLVVGAAELVGTDKNMITRTAMRLLIDDKAYNKMRNEGYYLYGDGKASARIITAIEEQFALNLSMAPVPEMQLAAAARAA